MFAYAFGCHVSQNGLCRTLRNLPWLASADARSFFPRCYDLADKCDRADFVDDFQNTAAVCVLRRFVLACDQAAVGLPFRRSALSAALRAGKQALEHLNGTHPSIDDKFEDLRLTAEEWQSVLDLLYILHSSGTEPAASPRRIDAERAHIQSSFYLPAQRICAQLQQYCPQWDMDGLSNIWVVKPGAASRGLGVVLHSRLDDILTATHHGHVVQVCMNTQVNVQTNLLEICDFLWRASLRWCGGVVATTSVSRWFFLLFRNVHRNTKNGNYPLLFMQQPSAALMKCVSVIVLNCGLFVCYSVIPEVC